MYGFKEKAVHIPRVPIDHTLAEVSVCLEHCFKLRNCKLKDFDFRECDRCQGQLNLEISCVVPRENCTRTVKTDDFSAPTLMVGKMNCCAGDKVVDTVIGLSWFPEVIPLVKFPLAVWL